MIPFGELHEEYLAEKAFLINEKFPEWIPISIPQRSGSTLAVNVSIEDNHMKSIVNYSANNYSAYDHRSKLLAAKNEEDYLRNHILEDPDEVNIDTFIIKDVTENLDKPFKLHARLTSKEPAFSGDMIYLDLFYSKNTKNPFTSGNRVFPVDFYHPLKTRYSYTLTIPDEYEIVEMPESVHLVTERKKAEYSYRISREGDKIMVLCEFKINEPIFYPVEYPSLKEIFDRMIIKEEEVLVLRKKN